MISMIPVTELRAALPLAYNIYGLSAWESWLWSVLGTFATMVVIIFLLDPIEQFLSGHIAFFKKIFDWLFEHTRSKAGAKMEKFGPWAIFILAAIPIPFLGGMTGALAAFLFDTPKRKSLPLLLLGTMLSGAIVLSITMGFTML